MGHLQLLGLKDAILAEPDEDEEANNASKNKETYVKLIHLLDHKSLYHIMRDAPDDGRKSLQIKGDTVVHILPEPHSERLELQMEKERQRETHSRRRESHIRH